MKSLISTYLAAAPLVWLIYKQWLGLFLDLVLTAKCSISQDNKGNIITP